MLNIHAIKKDTLYNVMLQQLYSLNYMWFRFDDFIRVQAPEAYGNEEYYQLQEGYGLQEAGRLVKALGFLGEEIKDLVKFLKYSHWAIFENIEIAELTANSFRMRTLDCSAQKAAKRRGTEYYDCRIEGMRIRSGFFKGINRKAKVQRIFTPPEARPKDTHTNVSCEWLISLD